MSKGIKIGIVGLGYWGPNLLRNFSQISGCEVKYGCDLKKELFDKLSTRYPNTKFTENYNDLLKDREVNGIAITTPVSSHYELAKQALQRGKHVLIEKPMASSVRECEDLIKIAEKKDLILAVDHTFLFTGAVRKIKKLIEKNSLGDIYYFDSRRINLGLIRNDINVIWDLASHDISIMNYLLEGAQPVSVFATGTKHIDSKVEEMAYIIIEFNSGQTGYIHVSWLSPVKFRQMLIGGSKKMLVYDDVEPDEKLKIYDKGISINFDKVTPFRPIYRSGDVYIPKLDNSEALAMEAEHFIKCIRKKSKPLVNGEAGLEVVKILEACNKSLKEKRKVSLK